MKIKLYITDDDDDDDDEDCTVVGALDQAFYRSDSDHNLQHYF